MQEERISIVIACYNDFTHVEQAINSAISQSWSNIEVIVIDDGSNAKTRKKLQELEKNLDLLIFQENQGVSIARNNAIERASGKYIAVLDSDDYFDPSFCEKAVKAFQQRTDVKLVTSYSRWFWNDSNFQIFRPSGGQLENFLIKNCALATMYLKKDWQKAGGYDVEMKQGFEDWEFYIRLHKHGGETIVIPEILHHYRKKHISRSSIANENKYELLQDIYFKHSDLYKQNFMAFTAHLLNKIKREEREKIGIAQRLEFRVGKAILKPYRIFKAILAKKKAKKVANGS